MQKCLLGMVTFNRQEMTQKCLESLFTTTDSSLYSLMIVDNASTDGTVDYLKSLTNPQIEGIFYMSENIGTAKALNKVWKIGAQRGVHVGKVDNDILWYDDDWLEKMLYVVDKASNVGLVGLKRRDLEEKPNHNDDFFRSKLFTMPNGLVIEIVKHVIGSCWLVSHNLLKVLGGLIQVGPYGFDDAIYCFRARKADFLVVFVPDVAIEHLDPGEAKYPEYTKWKQEQAAEIFQSGEYENLIHAYDVGERSLYEDFNV